MARASTHKVTLPEPLGTWARERMQQGGFATVDEYLRHLVRTDSTRMERAALEARLLQAMDSGPPIRATKKFWSNLRAKMERRVRLQSNGKER